MKGREGPKKRGITEFGVPDASAVSDRQDSSRPVVRQQGQMFINETTGNVEIPIRDFTELMLRIETLTRKLEELISERAEEAEDAVIETGDKMTISEFIAFSQEWLREKGKKCAIFRFSGHWSHVNDNGVVVGSWPSIDEALDVTECDNDCHPRAFRFD